MEFKRVQSVNPAASAPLVRDPRLGLGLQGKRAQYRINRERVYRGWFLLRKV